MKARPQNRSGSAAAFTLVEMLIVMFVVGLVASISLPFFVKTFGKSPIAQATSDIMDGLKHARDMAVLNATPTMFTINFETGSMSVSQAAASANTTYINAENTRRSSTGGGGASFSAILSPELMVDAAQHNLDPEAETKQSVSVLFQPNSTADLFQIVLKAMDGSGEQRLIKLDMITGKARMESDPKKFLQL